MKQVQRALFKFFRIQVIGFLALSAYILLTQSDDSELIPEGDVVTVSTGDISAVRQLNVTTLTVDTSFVYHRKGKAPNIQLGKHKRHKKNRNQAAGLAASNNNPSQNKPNSESSHKAIPDPIARAPQGRESAPPGRESEPQGTPGQQQRLQEKLHHQQQQLLQRHFQQQQQERQQQQQLEFDQQKQGQENEALQKDKGDSNLNNVEDDNNEDDKAIDTDKDGEYEDKDGIIADRSKREVEAVDADVGDEPRNKVEDNLEQDEEHIDDEDNDGEDVKQEEEEEGDYDMVPNENVIELEDQEDKEEFLKEQKYEDHQEDEADDEDEDQNNDEEEQEKQPSIPVQSNRAEEAMFSQRTVESKARYNNTLPTLPSLPKIVTKLHPALSFRHFLEREKVLIVKDWICIEKTNSSAHKRKNRKIVVYNSKYEAHRQVPGLFRLYFKTGPVPANSTLIANSIVAFVHMRSNDKGTASFVQNLHHVINDFAVTFYHSLKHMGAYGPEPTRNSLFLRRHPLSQKIWTRPILSALGATPGAQNSQFSIYDVPPNTCFSKGFFADASHNPWKKRKKSHNWETMKPMLDHVLQYFGVNSSVCPPTNGQPAISLIQRIGDRVILNFKKLKQKVLAAGFTNMRSVVFEKMSIRDQFITAYCTDVMMGLQGQALAWTSFMKPNGSLIEIAWPSRGWYFYYADKHFAAQFYPTIRLFQVEVEKKHVKFRISAGKGVLNKGIAKQANVQVPINLVIKRIQWAVSGHKSYAPRRRLAIGKARRFNATI